MAHVLTLVAPQNSGALTPAIIARVAGALRTGPARVLSPGEAAEFDCPAPPDASTVADALHPAPIDAIVTPAENRRKRLLVADMDSTIVVGETLDELAVFAGVGDRVAAITRRSMDGEIDFAAALRQRVSLLRGLPMGALERTWSAVRLTPGARTLVQTMRAHGASTALVSGGFTWFTARVAERCGFELHRANILLDDGRVLLGGVKEPILDRTAKLALMDELAAKGGLTRADCVAVGDGANDLEMIGAAGLGVAYRAKPVVAAKARARVVFANLRAVLFIQGYAASEFVE